MYKVILVAFVNLLVLNSSIAQSVIDKDELQKQRLQLKREIEETERILNETRSTTKVNLKDLTTINKRINLQDNVINNIAANFFKIIANIHFSLNETN